MTQVSPAEKSAVSTITGLPSLGTIGLAKCHGVAFNAFVRPCGLWTHAVSVLGQQSALTLNGRGSYSCRA